MKEPDKSKYHFVNLSDSLHGGEKKCPPMAENRGCYGDCIDCFLRDLDIYQKQQKEHYE